jgi:formylglycine-generating enzyme required for sulfatase activity
VVPEAQWEYVALAGTTTPFSTGANLTPAQANYDTPQSFAGSSTAAARKQTVPVGSYAGNAFGLYDVHGNVWEWTEDCWNANHAGAPSDGSAWTTGDCGFRVIRGGSWGRRTAGGAVCRPRRGHAL